MYWCVITHHPHPEMALLSLSVYPLLDQCLLHLHLTHTTDFLPSPQLVIVLTFRSNL